LFFENKLGFKSFSRRIRNIFVTSSLNVLRFLKLIILFEADIIKVSSTTTECVTDLDKWNEMIIFGLIFTIFELSSIFGGRWGSLENWLKPKTELTSGNFACPNPWNALYKNHKLPTFSMNNCFVKASASYKNPRPIFLKRSVSQTRYKRLIWAQIPKAQKTVKLSVSLCVFGICALKRCS